MPNLSLQQEPPLQGINNANLALIGRKRVPTLNLAPEPPPQGISITNKDQMSNLDITEKISVYRETTKRFKLDTNPSIRKQNTNHLMNETMQGLSGDNDTNVKTRRISAKARQTLHMGTEDHLSRPSKLQMSAPLMTNVSQSSSRTSNWLKNCIMVKQIINLANDCKSLIIPTFFV